MSKKTRAALLMSTLAASAVGCSDPPPATQQDSGVDADVVVTDVTDVPTDDGAMSCPTVTFQHPENNAVLGARDDVDGMCDNGFSYNVQIATNAPTGSTLELWVNGNRAATTTVTGPSITFPNVSLDVGATSTLEVRRPGETTPCGMTSARVDCALPRCQITAPMGSTLLAADNQGMPGMFATNFVVSTDVEDGQTVRLAVSGRTEPLTATATGGRATFNNVALSPDGTYLARATCTNRAGNAGTSAEVRYTVDSVPPTVEVQRPSAMSVIGLSGDVNNTRPGNQFQVCARSDAAGQQLCANVMGAMPDAMTGCAAVPSSAMTDACVEVTCPDGSAAFDVQVSTRDAAGNTTTRTISGLRCQSALPSVRVASPAAYDPMNAMTILNASRDADPMTRGFQTDIVACTDRVGTGVEARLFVLPNTDPVATAAVQPTTMGDPCATLGMGFVGIARFARVTLPQSSPERPLPTSPAPTNPTVRVDVRDNAGDTGQSTPTLFYVDSDAPSISLLGCGSVVAPGMGGTATVDVQGNSTAFPLTLTINRTGSMPQTVTVSAPIAPSGLWRTTVQLAAGTNRLTASTSDPAGNSAATDGNCAIEVGNPPTLAFTAPMAMQRFSAATGATTNITLRTDAPAGTEVTLTINGGMSRTAMADGSGNVTFSGVVLPQGDVVVLAARTANVNGRGVGTANITVLVDTEAPAAPTMLTGAVPTTPASARRAGTVRLTWNDGNDGTMTTVHGYQLRMSNAAITVDNFSSATLLSVPITPGAPGASSTVDVTGLQLGRQYYFALRAVDGVGNLSPTIAAAGPVSLDVVVSSLSDATLALGNAVSGGSDVNGDTFADMVLGTGIVSGAPAGRVRLQLGSAQGFTATNYVEFRGSSSDRFGISAASVGDVNGDGLGDVVIGESGPIPAVAGRGAVYVFFGRRNWRVQPMFYSSTEADVVISGGTGEFESGRFGSLVTRVGDFDGDGLNDIAAVAATAAVFMPVGTPTNTVRGAVTVFRGRRMWPSTLTPNNADLIIRNNIDAQNFGTFVSAGGRLVGNDTRDDLVVGMGLTNEPGRVFVFAGRDLTTASAINTDGAAFTRVGAPSGTIGNGQIIGAGVGDVNGDGRADLAVSSSAASAGGAFLYFGNATGGLDLGPTVSNTNGINSAALGQRFAAVDSSLGRPSLLIPRPTAADLVAGAVRYNGDDFDSRAYIWTGRSNWSGVDATNADRIVRASVSATSLVAVAGMSWLGDIDGDGYVDLAFGLPTGSGTVYVVR